MLVPGSSTPLLAHSAAAAATGISRSLRFNSSDSAYLSRTPASAGNRRTWTWAGWVKRSNISSRQMIFGNIDSEGNGPGFNCEFGESDPGTIQIADFSASFVTRKVTTQVFRDPSAWYHIVVVYDTPNATANDRVRLYVNGVRVTAFSSNTNPSQNYDGLFNTTAAQSIGRSGALNNLYLSAYLADIYFIDGQALTPSSFTETDATTGQLIPKAFSGSYGSQGWHLEFADNSSNTATTLGKDTSGNGNNWTPNNLSVTAGAGNDSLVDVPTNGAQTDTGVGGEVRGNYCTLNPLFKADTGTPAYSNGNLDLSAGGSGDSYFAGTFLFSTGKYYYETTINAVGNGVLIGVCAELNSTSLTNIGSYRESGTIYNLSSATQTAGSAYTTGDIIGVAIDCDNATVKFYKNGVGQGATPSFTFTAGTNLIVRGRSNSTGASLSFNFGQRAFAYTAPSGFKALCTANLPAPLVTKPNTVFDVKLYTGTGSSQSITGLGFSPNFLWFKNRSGANSHALFDTVRGRASGLISDSTGAEQTSSAGNDLSSFDSTGFTVGTPQNFNSPNINGGSIVAWAWDAGEGSAVTNTQGSISSQVRANASAGFSIVTYTGTGANATVGHGLGVAPSFVIVKSRSNTTDWQGYHIALGQNYTIQLQSTSAAINVSNYWNGGVSSTTFGINGSYDGINFSGYTYVAYCFAPVVGYSSFGSYTGNGATGWPNADGPFIYLGFRPRFVLWKCTSQVENWVIYDSARETYNFVNDKLLPNSSAAESTNNNHEIDFLSNGFKIRNNNGEFNQNAGTYIYAAFAESPFNYSRAR